MKHLAIILSSLVVAHGHAQRPISFTDALGLAGKNRASIQSARLAVEQAKLTRRSLSSSLPANLQLGYSSDVQVGGTDGDLVLAKPLDLFGRGKAFAQAGDAVVFRAEAGLRKSLVDLQNDVLESYLSAIASAQRLALAKRSEELASRLATAVQGLVDGGKLPGVQGTRAGIELDKQRVATGQRQSDYQANLKRLSGTVGTDATEIATDFPLLETKDANIEDSRPDLLLLQSEIRDAKAETLTAKAERLPQFEIQARKTPWQADSQSIGARLQFSMPIDFGKTRFQESAAAKRGEVAKKAYDDALRLAANEVEAVVIEIAGAKRTVDGLEQILSATDRLAERTQVGLKEGANTLIDVLDALRAKRETEESLIDAKLALAMAQAKYLRATGTLLEVTK